MLTEKDLSRNRFMYIIEAAVEYFIALLITGAFLASLLTRSGVSDAATGIITQLASLAFTAQLVSVFFRKTRGMKLFVTVLHLANQLMFVSLYLIPTIQVSPAVKTTCFVVMFLGGHLISNIISPYKLSWLMSFVPDNQRGRFTANKEIVSLIGGMIFSMLMSAVIDQTRAAGHEEAAAGADKLIQHGHVLRQRQHQRDSACGIDCIYIIRLHPLPPEPTRLRPSR